MQKITYIVKSILIINLLIFVLNKYLEFDFVYKFGLRYVFSDFFNFYQFFTHLFIHVSFWHLFGNMLILFFFGPILENTLGSKNFLIFYIIVGIGSGLLYSMINYFEIKNIESIYHSYILDPNPESLNNYINKFSYSTYNIYYNFMDSFFDYPNKINYIEESKNIAYNLYKTQTNIPVIGASGPISGILTAFGILFPNKKIFLLLIPFPIKAKYLIIFYAIYELYSGLQANPSDNIAHFAHLGGILFGFLFIKFIKKKYKN